MSDMDKLKEMAQKFELYEMAMDDDGGILVRIEGERIYKGATFEEAIDKAYAAEMVA